MNESPKQRWGCLQWGIVIGALLLLISLLIPFSEQRSPLCGFQGQALNNCQQVILTLKQYAKDADSVYPDGRHPEFKSANQVFRELFKEEIVSDERIYGSPNGAFKSDNRIGFREGFAEALMPGECHWMLLKDQADTSHPKTPLIIENSLKADWPPKWDVTPPEGLRKRGQAWRGREIIIGRNDGSVAVEKLRFDGTLDWHSAPNLDENGKSWIDSLTPEQIAKLAYWDIEEK
jgi:hypothetical protein